ncbi:transporter substrate-binding domain-containing protein [Alkalimarinus coralli]|uniref:transporter substrate-binding domain-containing protein n=1 Tax=Alkalimarinus coralli TaxID=2935863 RepID=UPI00202B36F7|nr:transporter substrate-binding domain-containing protein [Alkalimarinus coralli]
MTVITLCLFPSYALGLTSSHQEQVNLVIPRVDVSNAEHAEYFVKLLELAMEKTISDGRYQITRSQKDRSQARNLLDLEKGHNLNVLWTMTSKEREDRLLPIRIPLLKGLLGYRVFLIRKEDKNTFGSIQSLDGLRRFKAGQGAHWPDTRVLRENGIDVVTSVRFELLFTMLQEKRFDYFPRGINEAWAELKHHAQRGLIVEPSILLKYAAPMYFFVNRSDEWLANRIEKGLLTAIEDGSFDALFYGFPVHQNFFSLANIRSRKTFELVNPGLPEKTPLDIDELWYKAD